MRTLEDLKRRLRALLGKTIELERHLHNPDRYLVDVVFVRNVDVKVRHLDDDREGYIEFGRSGEWMFGVDQATRYVNQNGESHKLITIYFPKVEGALSGFAVALKELMTKAELNQPQLAHLVGCSKSYVSKLLKDQADCPPSDILLNKLAEALGENPDLLFILAGRIPPQYSGIFRQLYQKYGEHLSDILSKLLE